MYELVTNIINSTGDKCLDTISEHAVEHKQLSQSGRVVTQAKITQVDKPHPDRSVDWKKCNSEGSLSIHGKHPQPKIQKSNSKVHEGLSKSLCKSNPRTSCSPCWDK